MQRGFFHILIISIIAFCTSCTTTTHFTSKYYNDNKEMLGSIRDRYRSSYADKPFSIEFEDNTFRHISFEILTDTMRYIYSFDLDHTDFSDTLTKYNYN